MGKERNAAIPIPELIKEGVWTKQKSRIVESQKRTFTAVDHILPSINQLQRTQPALARYLESKSIDKNMILPFLTGIAVAFDVLQNRFLYPEQTVITPERLWEIQREFVSGGQVHSGKTGKDEHFNGVVLLTQVRQYDDEFAGRIQTLSELYSYEQDRNSFTIGASVVAAVCLSGTTNEQGIK